MEGQYRDLVRRAALPEILLTSDVALVLDLSLSGARKAIVRGDFGPYLRLCRRLAVRRESFLEALRGRELAAPGRFSVLKRGAPSRAQSRPRDIEAGKGEGE
jgi:hypothetical protein